MPVISHMLPFGCAANIVSNHRDKEERSLGTKWASKSEACIFLGYVLDTTKIYKVWSIKRKTAFRVSDLCIRFDENKFPGLETFTDAGEPVRISTELGSDPLPAVMQMPARIAEDTPTGLQKRAQNTVSQPKDLYNVQAGNEGDNGLRTSQIETSSQMSTGQDGLSEPQRVQGTDESVAYGTKRLRIERRTQPAQMTKSGRMIR